MTNNGKDWDAALDNVNRRYGGRLKRIDSEISKLSTKRERVLTEWSEDLYSLTGQFFNRHRRL